MFIPLTVRRLLGFVVGCCCLSLASCSKEQHPVLVPVEGEVFLGKTPARSAVVWLHAMEPPAPGTPRPRGVVDPEGHFVIGTYKAADGAPAGKYRVAIIWRAPAQSGDEDGGSYIPLRYMDPEQSGLPVVDVQKDPVSLPAYRLSRE